MFYRVFFFVVFFFSLSFGYELKELEGYQNLNKHITILYDTKEQYTVQNLPKEQFKTTNNLALGYVKGVVWSKLELANTNEIKLLLINPKININTIDISVFEGDNLIATHKLGNYRSISNNAIYSKFANFSLTMKPNKRYTIITKIKSKSPIDASLFVTNPSTFLSFIMYDILFWGVFLGFIFSLIIYNLSVFASLKEYTYVAYACHGLTALLFQFATNGIFYQFGLYENPLIFNSVSWILAQLSIISILFFATLFLNTKKTMPKVHTIILGLFFVLFAMMILFLYSFFDVEIINLVRSVTKPLSILILLFILVIAIIGVKKKIQGAWYYMMGHGIFLIAVIFQQFGGIINNEINFISVYIIAIGILFDVVFLSLALGQNLKSLKYEKEKNEKLLISQSGFSAIGRTIGNLSHQWKIPIARLGTLITQIEAMLWKREDKLKYEIEEVLINMKASLDFMQTSISEFNNFYIHSSQRREFNLANEIENIVNLLSAKVMYTNAKVSKNLNRDIVMVGYKSAFANICLVIIDNALDILKQRDITNGDIFITLSQDKESIKLTIEDNGGGIRIKPITKIFDVFVSDKDDGHGMGLAMVQVLTNERLHGKIEVKNSDNGAIFEITIPIE
ncbi:MAG: sensor histidine kinase [Arcobacteraceae bacterium]|nr:sensor histidine kinase [Arcobacteraceae bacterium]